MKIHSYALSLVIVIILFLFDIFRYWSYREYYEDSRTVAKAFIKLGLERFYGVCIMGSNAPEWVLANFGKLIIILITIAVIYR